MHCEAKLRVIEAIPPRNFVPYRDEEIRKQFKRLLSLAFVPPVDVIASFVECKTSVRQELIPLYDYWESTYIGAQRRGRRALPSYKIESWNQTSREKCGLPRTYNSVEGWHHGFQSMVGSDHPQIYSLIKSILKEQSITDVAKSRLAAGSQRPISAKSQYVRCGRRIQSLLQQYGTLSRIEFLTRI
jgi:hypothetical protein